MTTNNHPAHGPVSLDRLHQIREHLLHDTQYSNGGNRAYILADVLKVIDGAIAAFGAEPVAYMRIDGEDVEYNGHNEFSGGGKGVPLYTTPPAPVVDWVPLGDSPYDVPYSMPSNLRELIAEEIGILFSDDDAQSVWNACRATMLQAGNSPALSPIDHGYRPDCECSGCIATARICEELAANPPVTPDTWIPVSERMPPSGGSEQRYVLAADFRNHYWPNIPNTQVGVYGDWFNDGNPTWDDGDGEDLHLKEVTHWMPLPAAPQQEVK